MRLHTPILLAGAILFGGITQGQTQTVNTLVLTENSSTSLTATLNGTTLTTISNPSADFWVIQPPSGHSFMGPEVNWQEPGGFNKIFVPSPVLQISSDLTLPGETGLPNGGTDTAHFFINTAGVGTQPLDVTFIDNGDISTVPDSATTLPLLSLALAGLGFAKRKLF
jgi:hypothetical protein